MDIHQKPTGELIFCLCTDPNGVNGLRIWSAGCRVHGVGVVNFGYTVDVKKEHHPPRLSQHKRIEERTI